MNKGSHTLLVRLSLHSVLPKSVHLTDLVCQRVRANCHKARLRFKVTENSKKRIAVAYSDPPFNTRLEGVGGRCLGVVQTDLRVQ